MKQTKKVLIIFLIVTILMPHLRSFATTDNLEEPNIITKGLSKEQQDYVAYYVRKYLAEAHTMNPRPFIYDGGNGGYQAHYYQNEREISKLRQSGTVKKTGETYSNRMRTVCSVFTASMLHQALGVDIEGLGSGYGVEPTYRGAGYANPNGRGKKIFNQVSDDDILLPGDIISFGDYSHSMIYIGTDPETGKHQIAQTCGGSDIIGICDMQGLSGSVYANKYISVALVRERGGRIENGHYRYAIVSRLKPEVLDPNWTIPEVTKIQWPNGMVTTWEGTDGMTSTKLDSSTPVFYSGIASKIGTLSIYEPNIIETFGNIINVLTGFITMIIRVPFVGFASVAERLITAVVEVTSTQPMDSVLTLEKIVYNQVPIFDVNIFSMNEAGGQQLNNTSEASNIILTLRQNIAGWYTAFRNLVIVILLAILVSLGIRMAITSIAEEKAEYKRLLFDWFVSFFIVLFIHYFIIIVLKLNDYFVGIFASYMANSSMGSLYENANILAHSVEFTSGWYGAILYIALVWYMVKYAWKYAKRLLSMFILIILSPLVSISYAIDKIKDNRSQALSKWLKEIAFTVLIQSVHALIYTIFMAGIVANITTNNNILESIGNCVFLVIAVGFMEAAEDIFENIFGFKSSSTLKEVMNSSFEAITKIKTVTGLAKTYFKGTWWITKKGAKAVGKVTGTTMNFLAKHFNVANSMKESYENVKKGYKSAVDGQEIDETGTKTLMGAEKLIKQERITYKAKQQKEREKAIKQVKNSTNIVKNLGKAMPMLIEKPMAFITYSIAGGVSAKKAFKEYKRDIKTYKKNSKNTIFKGMREQKNKEQLLFDVRDKEIALVEAIEEAYRDEQGIINRGYSENATLEERKNAQKLQKLFNYNLREASKTVSNNDTYSAVKAEMLSITYRGQLNNIVRNNMDEILESLNLKDITDRFIDKTEGMVTRQFAQRNLKLELHRVLMEKATKEGNTLNIKFGELIDQSGNSLESRIEAIKTKPENMQLSPEEFQAKISDEIEEYLNDEANQETVIKNLNSNETADILVNIAEIANKENGEVTITSMENIAERIHEANPEIKINEEKYKENLRETVEEIMLHSALGQVETVNIKFGTEIDPLSGKILENKINEKREEARHYASHMQLSEREKNETEAQAIKEVIKEHLKDDKNLNDVLEQLSTNDISHVMVRSINREGSIERNYTFRDEIDATPGMDIEMQKFDAVLSQTIALRESRVANFDRLNKDIPDLAKEIKENVNSKRATNQSL